MPDHTQRHVALELPWRTVFKVLAAIVLVWCWLQLVSLILVVLVTVLLAVTLDPIVRRLEARGLPRWGGSTLVVLGLIVVMAALVVFATTQLSGQAKMVGSSLINAERQLLEHVPEQWRAQVSPENAGTSVQSYVAPLLLRVSQGIGSSLLVFALAAILTLYLLIEGNTTYAWLLAFVPQERRGKVRQTAAECQRVIFGYVAGNVATSVFATIFVVVVLSILKVPAAMLLALLAGVFDFVPVLGFIFSAVPAVVLALTRSPATALVVVLLYIAYHTIENYLIAPWVYGDRLQLSNIAVVLAFAVGAELAGIVGALIALPIAAAYPAIERIWLRDQLGDQVVQEHRHISRKAG
jgi:predicted PurR-regulated permease PerM